MENKVSPSKVLGFSKKKRYGLEVSTKTNKTQQLGQKNSNCQYSVHQKYTLLSLFSLSLTYSCFHTYYVFSFLSGVKRTVAAL